MNAGEAAIAVFLGPSTPEGASPLVNATYLPPAQFGDVYRLIGGGIRAVVLVDGVFHGRAPVWQRELLYAMESGIRVYGASSMGALRAAELHHHGMIGIGTIYEWYATGEIDGDDEVALLYAGAEHRYRSLTEPLVNLRYNLREAVAQGIVELAEAAAMLADMAAMPFWERTRSAFWETPACRALEPSRSARLRAFFEREAIDLKRRDAALALAEVARRERERAPGVGPEISQSPSGPSYHDSFRLLERAFRPASGETIRGRVISDRILAAPARRRTESTGDAAPRPRPEQHDGRSQDRLEARGRSRLVRWSLAARFFAWQWALTDADIVASAAREEPARATLPGAAELCARSLTVAEHAARSTRARLWAWLLDQPVDRFGLSSSLQDEALLSALPDVDMAALQPLAARAGIARALPYVAAWCERCGAQPPLDTMAALEARWRTALDRLASQGQASDCEPFLHAVWALDKGPVHFGYATWSVASELLGELQIIGAVGPLLDAWDREDG